MEIIPPLAVSIAEACRISGVCKTSIYAAIKAGTLSVKKSGRRTLVPIDSLKAWLAGLPSV